MRSFNLKYDFSTLANWMTKRELPAPYPNHLPPTGVIVDNAACGFIIKCDNGTAIIDFVMSNPDIPAQERSEAIDEVVSTLIETAKMSGIHSLYCNTHIDAVYDRALKHGFEPIGSFKALMRGL